MRGGVFDDGYRLDTQDLLAFVQNANRDLAAAHAAFFRRLPEDGSLRAAGGGARARRATRSSNGSAANILPLTFSRRHGDPSRPWNRFSIATRNADGTRRLNYEGNWRDIFQNWEALALSFPGYTSGMICRFLNASTADGYNPYRITRNGIDWEVVDPHDPWSYIGYWGDHQIIYLLKLLEHLERHEPEALRGLLTREIFAYANVPYRIKPYRSLLADPKDTVVFDQHLEELVHQRVAARGADGKLVWDKPGQVRLVNLTEKLLVPLLAKLSNFIPGAGIWLNTQRPEWNDANNALVGNGTSMVTLYYIRRYLTFCRELFRDQCRPAIRPLRRGRRLLRGDERERSRRHRRLLAGKITDAQRKRVVDDLGRVGSDYRQRLYDNGILQRAKPGSAAGNCWSSSNPRWTGRIIPSRPTAGPTGFITPTTWSGSRTAKALPIRRLYEMLEGQVAVLSSGHLSAEESLTLLTSLKRSAMYRADQHSYLLYPDREPAALCREEQHPRRGTAPFGRCCERSWPTATGNSSNAMSPGAFISTPRVKNARDIRRPPRATRGHALRPPRQTRGAARAGNLRAAVRPRILHGPLRHLLRLRGSGLHLLAHGLQTAAGRAGNLLPRPRNRRLEAGVEAVGGLLLRHSRRHRRLQDAGRLRRVPDGSLFAHPGSRGRTPTGPHRTGQGGRPLPLWRTGRHWSRAARSTSAPGCCGGMSL